MCLTLRKNLFYRPRVKPSKKDIDVVKAIAIEIATGKLKGYFRGNHTYTGTDWKDVVPQVKDYNYCVEVERGLHACTTMKALKGYALFFDLNGDQFDFEGHLLAKMYVPKGTPVIRSRRKQRLVAQRLVMKTLYITDVLLAKLPTTAQAALNQNYPLVVVTPTVLKQIMHS